MKFMGALAIGVGLLGIMFTIRTPPGTAATASTAVGGVASGVA